ncbi:hypothetical protein BH23BAC4_BH23BAC4_08970 [soil metagenome]
MRPLLLALLFLILPSAVAQTIEDVEPTRLAAPITIVTDTLDVMEGYPIVRHTAVGADGARFDIVPETWREPTITDRGNGWLEYMINCGTECFFSIFVDKRGGVISPPVWYVLAFDEQRRRAVFVEEDLVWIGHPMRLGTAASVELPYDSVMGRLLPAISDVRIEDDGSIRIFYYGEGGRPRSRLVRFQAPGPPSGTQR